MQQQLDTQVLRAPIFSSVITILITKREGSDQRLSQKLPKYVVFLGDQNVAAWFIFFPPNAQPPSPHPTWRYATDLAAPTPNVSAVIWLKSIN